MERTIDLIAGTLGLEPAEVRRRNMIRAEEMPYPMGIPYRDGEPVVYDSGDFPGVSTTRWRRSADFLVPLAPTRGTTGRVAILDWASPAMSRAPASGRSKAPPCASSRWHDLCHLGRLSPGTGYGDDLRTGCGRHLGGRSPRCHHITRRHVADRDRVRHVSPAAAPLRCPRPSTTPASGSAPRCSR